MRKEQLIYFGNEWISAVLDLPKLPPVGLAVISHGLTGDRVGPQKLLVHIAEALTHQQIAVVRFDYRNAGDSSGSFEQTRFFKMDEDLFRVIRWAKQTIGNLPLALIGFSIGALPCIQLLSQEEIALLVILSADLIDQPSFTHLNEEKIPFRGGAFTLSRFFFEERKALSPRALLEQSSIPRYLFYGSNDTKVKEAAVCLEKIGVIPFEFKGVDHLFESYIIRLEMIRSLTHLIQEHIYGTQQPPDSLSHYEKRGPLSSQVH